jgi:hypothetical protein
MILFCFVGSKVARRAVEVYGEVSEADNNTGETYTGWAEKNSKIGSLKKAIYP